ncbi:MAG TPA: ABC transporter ATP-binding protein [Acidimicrobiia bacterium]|nr:ABC transporter ATP-binding protein [Acidimicrobiia bacterium]
MSDTRDVAPPGSDGFDDEEEHSYFQTPREAGGRFGVGVPAAETKDLRGSTRRLISYLGPEKGRAMLAVVLAIVAVVLNVSGPRLLGHATNIVVDGITSRHGIDFGALHRQLAIVAAVYISSWVLAYTQGLVLTGVIQRSMKKLRSEVEDKLNRLPLATVDRTPRGDLLSRVTNDIDNLAQSLQQTMSQTFISTFTLVGVLAMMISISPLLALVVVFTIPIAVFGIKAITARSKKRFIEQWTHTGSLNAQVEEAFTGHALVRAFGREHDIRDRFDTKNEQLHESSFWAQFIAGVVQPVMMFLGNLNYVLIAVIGGLRVVSGQMSIGDIQAFIQYSRQFTQPLTQLASMVNVLQSGIASAERVFEFLDFDDQVADDRAPLTNPAPRGLVEFEHVRFSYDPDKPLIRDLSLVAPPGSTVAIVGPTGAGKTTLVNLIMRFYELDGGTIRLDGRDISRMRRHDLREHIGMVLQDTWLFEGTIRDNIAFGNPDATEDEIVEAAKATHVDFFVRSLPNGYDTIVDDEGTNVSAGEKQLLTIARAFLADPAILILDEATSSVDTRTEVLIQKAMAALRTNRTSFVIAHRLSTIRDADTILVMNHGDIVEQGNHHDLLERGGAYAALYNAQFVGAAVDVDQDLT